MTMPVPRPMKRSAWAAEEAWLGSAVATIGLICRQVGVESLAGLSMLDVGCGTKLTKAFLERDVPIGRYVGIDVYSEMIEHLREQVTDPRFEYRHMDLHNEMYNPTGTPMSQCSALPIDECFDVIGLFSVFTHLAPHDFGEMLRLLRPCAKPATRLVFSLYLNETTPSGHGLIDKMAPYFEKTFLKDPDRLHDAMQRGAPDFVDHVAGSPLKYAVYSRPFAHSLLEESDWEVVALEPPEWFIQHHFVCRPR